MKLDWANLLAGFFLGVGASAIVALAFEYASGPKLRITRDHGARARAGSIEYYHVVVRNPPTSWPLPSRRPAWACRATLNVCDSHGQSVTGSPVLARWSSQPEPITSFSVGAQVVMAADLAKMIAGRQVDVHCHFDERLVIAIKEEGDDDVFLFTNESYAHVGGRNPAWRLAKGEYRVSVSAYYEQGSEHSDFKLVNAGPRRSDVSIEPWVSPAT